MDEPLRPTQAAYAKARELSRQRVNQLVKDGRIPLDENGRVIVEQSDLNLAALLDQRKANRSRQIILAGGNQAGASDELPLLSRDNAAGEPQAQKPAASEARASHP